MSLSLDGARKFLPKFSNSNSTNKENSKTLINFEKKDGSFPDLLDLKTTSPLRSKRSISPSLESCSGVAPKKPSPKKQPLDYLIEDEGCSLVRRHSLTRYNLLALGKSDEFKTGDLRQKSHTSEESLSTFDDSRGASARSFLNTEGSSSCDSIQSLSSASESFNGSFSDYSSRLIPFDFIEKTGFKSQKFSPLSNFENDEFPFKSVRETLCKSPLISPKGDSVNDVYRVPGNIDHSPYYFKNSGPVNELKILNLTLNKLFKQLLNDSSVQLGNYEEFSGDELKFEQGKHDIQNIMLVQQEIDSRFKPVDSVENINQLYSFYNDGKNTKEHFQRALLYSILTGQYDEHSGNLSQDKTTKHLCRYDLDLSFSGGRILKDYSYFDKELPVDEFNRPLTRFGLRSVLLFAITKDSHKLLVDECLSEDLKSDLLTLISINLDDHFPPTISEESSILKLFINSNFLKIKGLLNSEKSVTLLDVLKVCYPEVAIVLEASRNLLNTELLEKPQDSKEVLRNWFNAVNKCFGDFDFFEDMECLRMDSGDVNLNFLGKITAHLFNEDGSVKMFLPESTVDINKS